MKVRHLFEHMPGEKEKDMGTEKAVPGETPGEKRARKIRNIKKMNPGLTDDEAVDAFKAMTGEGGTAEKDRRQEEQKKRREEMDKRRAENDKRRIERDKQREEREKRRAQKEKEKEEREKSRGSGSDKESKGRKNVHDVSRSVISRIFSK